MHLSAPNKYRDHGGGIAQNNDEAFSDKITIKRNTGSYRGGVHRSVQP